MDLSPNETRLEKEKYNFYCVVNKLMYVTPTISKVFMRGIFCAVLLEEMEILSRTESFVYVTAYF